jgi:NitT/TauT family transport system permease protein
MAMYVSSKLREQAAIAVPLRSLQKLVRAVPQLTISPAILVAILATWWAASHVLKVPTYIVPPPEQVWRAIVNGLVRLPWDAGGYWYHAAITVWEALIGFVIGSVTGAVLGFALVHWPILEKSAYPYVVGFQSLPKVALAPLMVVWFGFGLEGKVFITAVITFFPVLVNTMAGYQSVEPERIELARSCNASQWQLISKIIIPSCLPFLFAGLNVASVLAILGAVVGELVGARAGLGMLLTQYNQSMELGPEFAVILLLGVIGFLMNHVVKLVERRFCFWAHRNGHLAGA